MTTRSHNFFFFLTTYDIIRIHMHTSHTVYYAYVTG